MTGPYSQAARRYLAAGWSPLPLPARRKKPPPKGWTGRAAQKASGADVEAWCEEHPDGNLALWLGPGSLGIDVDAHKGPAELAAWQDLVKRYGPLPESAPWCSSRDDGVSGIRFFAVPDEYEAVTNLGIAGEVIQHFHRYAVVPPSISPPPPLGNSQPYRWINAPNGRVPNARKLPPLPPAWLEGLRAGSPAAPDGADKTGWTNPDIDALVEHGISADTPRHDDQLRDVVWKLHGQLLSKPVIRATWQAIVARTPLKDPARPWTDADFERHWQGASHKQGRLIFTPPQPASPDGAANPGAAEAPAGGDRDAEEDKPKQTQAALLVKLARERYDLITGDDGRPYAVARNGPAVARPLRGRGGLREQLARIYSDACRGAVASASAFTDAIAVLEGHASQADPVPVYLRVAPHSDGIVLDLGTPDGRCIIAGPAGWRRESRSPVLFRRTALTMALPDPLRGGSLSPLQELLNASEATFRLMAGWLLAALIPWIPHPILALLGEQGTAKSSAARLLIGLIDPSPAPLRSPPRDVRQWAITASAGWTVCIDNVSAIPDWLSDCLCKAVTGDGIVDRALYTDDDVIVLAFRRVIALTSIDAGELRGDLGDRLLPAELDRIDEAARRTDEQITTAYDAALPQLLGAILTLLCDCLARLPDVELENMPRMADFARLLAALDQAAGWDTLATYETTAADIAETVVESDLFAEAIRELVTTPGSDARWEGTASKLREHITPAKPPKWWPRTPRAASGRLRRSAPSLRRIGVEVTFTRQPGTGVRIITVECADTKCGLASHGHTVTPPSADQQERRDANDGDHDGRDANDGVTQSRTLNLDGCPRHQTRFGPRKGCPACEALAAGEDQQ
jgi:hypothetical protein